MKKGNLKWRSIPFDESEKKEIVSFKEYFKLLRLATVENDSARGNLDMTGL